MEIAELEKKYEMTWKEMLEQRFIPVELHSTQFDDLWKLLEIHENMEDPEKEYYWNMPMARYFEIFETDPMGIRLVKELAKHGKCSVSFEIKPWNTKKFVSALTDSDSELIAEKNSSFIATILCSETLRYSRVTVWKIQE